MKNILFFIGIVFSQLTIGQDEIWIKPNKGQWHENISYKIEVPGGNMYLEKSGFTYDFTNSSKIYEHAHSSENDNFTFKRHVVKTTFINANPQPEFIEKKPSQHYENYIIGDDPSKWVNHLILYNEVDYINLYQGIHLNIYENNATLKYDIIVEPGIDPHLFKVGYSGQEKLELKEDELIIHTSLGTITELKPIAYQIIDDQKKMVPCKYVLTDTIMSFDFPEGFDTSQTLIIDPDLIFSSFTGSSADNWGMTACPDINKNLIAGGIIFGNGYPTTTGAYSSSLNNTSNSGYPGIVDIGITKFNATGSSIIYSTYIGGNGSETPHSIIVNNQNELYIMGATSSTDFPVSSTAFQSVNQLGGGIFDLDGINFSNGVDLFIFKLSSDGGSMLASTYLGGTNSDGLTSTNLTSINYNYGDHLRGEIKLDNNSNVYIASNTNSNDFPINGGFDATLGGIQDGIVAKLNPNLSSLLWSTYLGGSDLESGNALTINSIGDIYVVGGTTSSDLPNTTGQLNPGYLGGITDGYIAKFPAPTYNQPKISYLGTVDYDQAYFVDTDIDDKVYVYGQSEGSYSIIGNVYNNPNSGQFIHKLNANLTTTEWSSVFGASSGHVEISPTAFLVSDCYEIYIAGWGGNLNINYGSADFSTTNGFPITSDAYQSQTSGSNFYLALFTQDMATLKYATYMGSLNGSNDHVDGGTSRFDKSGKVYHAVCAACGGNPNGFPTTPGAYSTTNQSNNCNLAAFLFDVSKIEATLATTTPVTCLPNPTQFENNSENGNAYLWDFGDGSTSTDFEPSHLYANGGTYTVMLVVYDVEGCYDPDTAYTTVEVILPDFQVWALSDTVCPGASVQVFATGGNGYAWGPPDLFDDPSSASPIVTINEETDIIVDISSDCGTSQLQITLYVFGVNANSSDDIAICIGDSTQLSANGGSFYEWSPAQYLDNPSVANPWATPVVTTYFNVEIITPEGCVIYDTTKVTVDQDIPYPILADSVGFCKGSSVQIIANGATDYLWLPNYNINDNTIYNPIVNPETDTSYIVKFTNACGYVYDTVRVDVVEVNGAINNDTIICPGESTVLWASGGVEYRWSPSTYLTTPSQGTTIAKPFNPTTYSVLITDTYGCQTSLSTFVDIYPQPEITVSSNVYGIVGDTVLISAEGNGTIEWNPPLYISCTTCNDTYVYPPSYFTYTATLTDLNGCKVSGAVEVIFDPLIFVPNAFTPDGDTYNNTFFAVVNNISAFEMYIFNRWGELIFISNSVDQQWDGTYNGEKCLDDVYVWKIRYKDLNGIQSELMGHVTLLR